MISWCYWICVTISLIITPCKWYLLLIWISLCLSPMSQGYYKDTVEFYFESRNECKNFWKKCIEHHAFFRCHQVKRLPRNKTRVVSRGSSFRSVSFCKNKINKKYNKIALYTERYWWDYMYHKKIVVLRWYLCCWFEPWSDPSSCALLWWAPLVHVVGHPVCLERLPLWDKMQHSQISLHTYISTQLESQT